jgi:hypothetical protein
MHDGILDDFFKYLPEKERVEFKVFPHFYEMELFKTKQELTEMLYKLKDELHPQILFTTGRVGTLNDLNWLTKNKKYFFNSKEKKKLSRRDTYRMYMFRLGQFSSRISGMLFGEFADEPYESELVYTIASDTFRKMGLHSYVRTDEDDKKRVYVDLSKLGLGMHAYRFVPWTSGLDVSVGKVMKEYYLDRDLHVEMGLKPVVFRLLSSAVTTPAHEVIHHISSMYNRDAYSHAMTKIFDESFKDIPNIFNLSRDRGTLLGTIDKRIKNKGFDIRGKDLSDPFIFWDIVKKHGVKIAEACNVPLSKLYEASFNYLSRTLPFRFLEEGVASYLSIENASIEKPPSEFSGLDNSLKNLVEFGAKLEKLNYLERKIYFYTGEKKLPDYCISERQLYPVSYLYVAYRVNEEKPTKIRWYFDLIKNNFLRRGIPIPTYQRTIERKRREDLNPRLVQQRRLEALIQEMNRNIDETRRRLNEVDNLLREYRSQLNRLEESRPSFDFPEISYRPHRRPLRRRNERSLSAEIDRFFSNRRVRSTISREMRENYVFRTIIFTVAGVAISYGISQLLRKYLLD